MPETEPRGPVQSILSIAHSLRRARHQPDREARIRGFTMALLRAELEFGKLVIALRPTGEGLFSFQDPDPERDTWLRQQVENLTREDLEALDLLALTLGIYWQFRLCDLWPHTYTQDDVSVVTDLVRLYQAGRERLLRRRLGIPRASRERVQNDRGQKYVAVVTVVGALYTTIVTREVIEGGNGAALRTLWAKLKENEGDGDRDSSP